MIKKNTQRSTIELGRKRIPLRKLLHGKEIREAAKALEDFRLSFNEEEILYGATLTIKSNGYDNFELIAARPETDKECADRLEKVRIAAEKKAERERKRKELEIIKAKKEEEASKSKALETLRFFIDKNQLTEEDIAKLLKIK